MSTGAHVIVEELERAGVEVCFGLPGVHNLALWEALRSSSIRLVGVRHEQAAAYAADGYARATGRLGVALTTTGPGAANTLGAVGEAWASRSPVLVIATDIPSALRRPGEYRGVLHETAGQAEMFAPVVKSLHLGLTAEAVAPSAAAAIASALTAPTRPVYLEIATDLLAAQVPAAAPPVASVPLPAPEFGAAIERLDAAERPLLWVGGGARDAADAITALAEQLAAPVLTTYGAAGVLPPGHPCLVGLPPHVEAAGRLWDEADVVLAIGSDLDGVQTQNFAQPQPDTLIAVSLEEPVNYRVDVHLRGDAGDVARALAAGLGEHGGLEPLADRLAAGALRGLRRARRDRAALPRRDPLRRPRRRRPGRRHVHPGLLARRLPHARRAAPPAGAARLGDARLRLPGRARRGARGRRPRRLDLRRRRLPLRLRRARHDGPGADPADRGDRRRRRLRHAPLRPAARRRRVLRRRSPHAGLRAPSPPPSASAPRPSTASTTRSARPSPSTWPTRRRRCWSPAPRRRSSRRRTPRRTGTAGGG